MSLCDDCGEPVEVYRFHPRFHSGCCSHEDVESFDDRDGVGGRRYDWCHRCGSEVIPVMNEGGRTSWETP
jgi:hypothetical protein